MRRVRKMLLTRPLFFLTDVLSLVPTDALYFAIKRPFWPFVRSNRLLKLNRILEFVSQTETSTNFPYLFRITYIYMAIIVIIHWNACSFDDDNLSNLVESGFDPKLNFVAQYSKCFYRSTLVLTTISNIEPPASSFEKIYMIVSYMIGVIVFAIIVGSITEIIDDLNMKQSEFQKNVDLIKSFMHVASVERTLQQRVINWFNHSWMVNNGMDEQLIFQESLPENLQAEIAINVHLETLKRVHIFQDCEPGLLKQLVTRLKLQVFSPGDFICRKGDIGREMYFVKSGKLSVVSDDGATVFVNLEEGSYFGEISILDIPGNKTGNRRTANVKSSGYSDLFCLTKADLWQALDEYPLAKKALIEKGKSLLRKDNLIDEDEAAEAEKLEHKKSMLEDDLYMLRFELDHVEQRLAKINSFVQTGADLLNKRIDRLENKLKTLH